MAILSKIKAALGITPKTPELISVVLSFRRPIAVSEPMIHSAIVRAWGRDVRADGKESVFAQRQLCFVNFEGIVLMLTNSSKPYCPPEYLEQAIAQFPEERQKRVAREHKGFLAIDLLTPRNPSKAARDNCYRRMARLAAELVDDNCLGVYVPETGCMRPNDSGLITALRSEKPLLGIEG